MYEAVFLDRDGTVGGDQTIHYPGQFELFPFTEAAIKKIKQKNIKLFSFTNQPVIAEGRATEMDFINELKTFGFDGMYLCPQCFRKVRLQKAAARNAVNSSERP